MSASNAPNIFAAFKSLAEKHANKTAVVFLGTHFTYGRLLDYVEHFASGLSAIGLQKGDRIVMYIPNSIQFVVSWLGIQRLGGVAVPITPIYTPFDLKYIANDTGAKAVVCSDRNFGYVKQVIPETQIERAIVMNLADILPWWKRFFGWVADKVPNGTVEKADFVSLFSRMVKSSGKPAPAPDPGTGEEDLAEILFTGGTTKHPKGVPISHGLYLLSSEEQLAVRNPLFPMDEDIILGGAPLFHVLGQTCSLATVIVGGGTLITQPRINLDAVFDCIQRNRATSLIGVPAFYRMVLEHDRVDQYDLSSLRYCFAAGDVLPIEVANRWTRRFKLPIFQGYGATETCGGIVMGPTDRENPALAMGLKVPSKEVMIADPNGAEAVPPGEPGELLVSSDKMVRYYWNKPEETAEAFTEINGQTLVPHRGYRATGRRGLLLLRRPHRRYH